MTSTEKTAHEVADLKRKWLEEPTFDITIVEDFEKHQAELKKFVRDYEVRMEQCRNKPHLVDRDLEIHIPISHRYGAKNERGINLYEFVEEQAENLESRSRYGGGAMIDSDIYEIAVRMNVKTIETYMTILSEYGITYVDRGLAEPLRPSA